MKRQFLRPFLPLCAMIASGAMLAACAGDPVYVACPDITAPKEGTAAFMKMDDTGEIVDVRLNGVRGLCEPLDGGGTSVDLSVGLKLKRVARDNIPAGVAQIDIISFIVDGDDKVVSSDPVKYQAGFSKGTRIIYPVAEYSTKVGEGQRIVLSLVPTL